MPERIRTVYAEMDNEPRKAFPIPASLIVRTSPGRAHWYWLTDPVDPPTISEARAMQRTIVAHYGADAHAADIARVLRLAGTWHQKGRPHLVSIVEGSGYRYRRGQLLEAFPPARDRSAPGPVAFGEKLERYKTAAIWGIVAEVVAAPPGCRNSTLNKAAFRLGQLGFPRRNGCAPLASGDKYRFRRARDCNHHSVRSPGRRRPIAREAGMSAKEASGGSQIAISTGPLRPKQSDILIQLAVEEAALFSTDDGVAYADVWVDGHRETYPVKSSVFRQWMMRRFFEVTSGAPNSEAMTTAVSLIEATARFGAPRKSVLVRVGAHGGKIYLDLANHAWEVVEIDANGWRIVADPPIRFRRAPGMRTLPKPESGGRIDLLRPFVERREVADFVLVVAWLLAALRPTGPYPVVVVTGEQGAAKSTFTALLRRVVTPTGHRFAHFRRTSMNCSLQPGMGTFSPSTTCRPCRLGLVTRSAGSQPALASRLAAYSQTTRETLFDAARPIMCNGIEEFVTRADFADRSILLVLERFLTKSENRKRTSGPRLMPNTRLFWAGYWTRQCTG